MVGPGVLLVLTLSRCTTGLRSSHGRGLKPPARVAALASTPSEIMFEAQQAAMAASAELEGACFEGRVTALAAPSLASKPSKKKRRSGAGFGGAAPAAETAADAEAGARWKVLKKEGILKIEGAITPAVAADLRAYAIADLAAARRACAGAADADRSAETGARFHASAEGPLRSFLLTPLDEPACHEGLRGLLARGSPLGDVFERACGGDDALFYDYNALRTERGSPRQPVHWDTPFQALPPLYTAFVALQDVTREMGATLFLPRTHTLTAAPRASTPARAAGRARRCWARRPASTASSGPAT